MHIYVFISKGNSMVLRVANVRGRVGEAMGRTVCPLNICCFNWYNQHISSL